MLEYFQSQRLAVRAGVSAETVEKDYFIELVLFYLAKDVFLNERLIFRGGTALKKVYFSDYRFSEDLDFLIGDKENLDKYNSQLTKVLGQINSEYPFNLKKRLESEKDRLQFFISYNILPEIRAVKELKVDIIKDNYIPPTIKKRILFSYQEFKHKMTQLRVYVLESVVVDKISRILDVDNEPRDLYDLWYLLNLDLDVRKIKNELNKKFGYVVYYPNLLDAIKNEEYKRNWDIRLTKQINNLPAYEFIIEELGKFITEKIF